jgi:hypothetical protein
MHDRSVPSPLHIWSASATGLAGLGGYTYTPPTSSELRTSLLSMVYDNVKNEVESCLSHEESGSTSCLTRVRIELATGSAICRLLHGSAPSITWPTL